MNVTLAEQVLSFAAMIVPAYTMFGLIESAYAFWKVKGSKWVIWPLLYLAQLIIAGVIVGLLLTIAALYGIKINGVVIGFGVTLAFTGSWAGVLLGTAVGWRRMSLT